MFALLFTDSNYQPISEGCASRDKLFGGTDKLFHLLYSVGLQTEQAMHSVCHHSSLQTYTMETAGSNWLMSSMCIKILPNWGKKKKSGRGTNGPNG